jgi:hypothetical protein
MQTRLRTYGGTVFVLSGLPVWTQAVAQTGTASTAASTPDGPSSVVINDPGWFIAGFVTGVVVGVVAGKVFGGSKSNSPG